VLKWAFDVTLAGAGLHRTPPRRRGAVARPARLRAGIGVWFRRLAERLIPHDIDALAELALTNGVMTVVRRSARFNWHRRLILETLCHPGVLRIVLRRPLAVGV